MEHHEQPEPCPGPNSPPCAAALTNGRLAMTRRSPAAGGRRHGGRGRRPRRPGRLRHPARGPYGRRPCRPTTPRRRSGSTSPTGPSTWTSARTASTVRRWTRFNRRSGIAVKYTEDINDNNEFYGKIQAQLAAGQDTGRDLIVLTDWMCARMISPRLDPAAGPGQSAARLRQPRGRSSATPPGTRAARTPTSGRASRRSSRTTRRPPAGRRSTPSASCWRTRSSRARSACSPR